MITDVVYKLGSGSKHDNLELRYSLRSLQNFKDLGKVYIVGFLPQWITNVIHMPLEDVFLHNKDGNLVNKIILAGSHSDITTEFINMSDDQVFLIPCTYEDFTIPYYDNKLINFTPEQKLNRWKTRLRNTVNALQGKGLTANCYEAHIPTLINKNDYLKSVFQYPYPEGQGMCGNTLYFNTIKKLGKSLPDNFATRLEDPIVSYQALEELCNGRLHLNYSENATNENLLLYLKNNFSEKSIYEKDGV